MTQDTNQAFYDRVSAELADIDTQGLTKPERVIASRQGPVISVNGRDVLNFCANNYLGLAGDERVTQAGIKAQEKWGGDGLGPLHLRHAGDPQGTGARDRRLSRL